MSVDQNDSHSAQNYKQIGKNGPDMCPDRRGQLDKTMKSTIYSL